MGGSRAYYISRGVGGGEWVDSGYSGRAFCLRLRLRLQKKKTKTKKQEKGFWFFTLKKMNIDKAFFYGSPGGDHPRPPAFFCLRSRNPGVIRPRAPVHLRPPFPVESQGRKPSLSLSHLPPLTKGEIVRGWMEGSPPLMSIITQEDAIVDPESSPPGSLVRSVASAAALSSTLGFRMR